MHFFLSNKSNKGFAYSEIEAVNIIISKKGDNSFKNSSTKGLLSTYNNLSSPSKLIVNVKSLLLEKGAKAE